MKRRRQDAVANHRADIHAPDKIVLTIDPLLVVGRDEAVNDPLPPQHRFEIQIRRPDAMHAMFVWEFPPVDVDLVFARQSSACAFIRFEEERLESAFGEVECGGESCHSPADDDSVVVIIHYGDYMSELNRLWRSNNPAYADDPPDKTIVIWNSIAIFSENISPISIV